MRKRLWAVSSNGPDEVDLETMMRAMGALHSGVAELQLSPLGIGGSGGLITTARLIFHTMPGSALPAVVGATSNWPCKQCKSFYGHLYHLLHALDQEVGKAYRNEELWK